MKESSDSSLSHPKPEMFDFIGKAKSAFENGRTDEAIRIYEDAISRGHKNGENLLTGRTGPSAGKKDTRR